MLEPVPSTPKEIFDLPATPLANSIAEPPSLLLYNLTEGASKSALAATSLLTSSVVLGVVVPIPILPLESIKSRVLAASFPLTSLSKIAKSPPPRLP